MTEIGSKLSKRRHQTEMIRKQVVVRDESSRPQHGPLPKYCPIRTARRPLRRIQSRCILGAAMKRHVGDYSRPCMMGPPGSTTAYSPCKPWRISMPPVSFVTHTSIRTEVHANPSAPIPLLEATTINSVAVRLVGLEFVYHAISNFGSTRAR